MSRKRSELELIADILLVMSKGNSRKTRIMQGAYLSWNSFWKVFRRMIEKGLVEEKLVYSKYGEGKKYVMTEKGKEFLETFKKLREMIV